MPHGICRRKLIGWEKHLVRSFLQVVWRRWCYRRWLASYDTHGEAALRDLQAAVLALPFTPLISVLVPAHNTPARYLTAMIDSVRNQIYPHWELCLVDDASDAEHVRQIMRAYASQDSRIRVIERPVNGHISAASNTALGIAKGAYIALLDHDDVLPQHALSLVVKYINDLPRARLFYSDEDKITSRGKRHSPYFKPDWDPELILQQNVFNHLGVFETALVRSVGGFRLGYEGSQDHDLVLRCMREAGDGGVAHIPHVLYHWRATKQSTASIADNKPYAADARNRAVNDHLAAVGRNARTFAPPNGRPFMSIADVLPEVLPVVQILLDAFDDGDQVDTCLNSLARTSYAAFRITIIASQEKPPSLVNVENATVLLVQDRAQWEMVANDILANSEDEYVCLVDARTRLVEPAWLTQLVALASRPEVGLCGVRWFGEDGHVLAAGFVREGRRIIPARPGRRLQDPGYFGLNLLTRRTTTLPGLGVVANRAKLLHAGGLSQTGLGWLVGGAFLSQRMAECGLHNLVVAGAALMRSGRASNVGDMAAVSVAPAEGIGEDQYYNPNLSLTDGVASFHLAFPPRCRAFD